MKDEIHPAPEQFSSEQLQADPILQFFHFAHLPAALRSTSQPFCNLASQIVGTLPRNAERSVALRKLLEAKDAAVRANVGAALASGGGSFVDRLKVERAEVKTRLGKLVDFIVVAPPNVSKSDMEMLRQQSVAMTEYLAILNARIENIGHGARLGDERLEEEPEVRKIGDVDQDRDGDPPFGD